MDTYEKRRSWSDQYLDKVREIVGPYLLESSPFDVDVQRATDLVILRGKAIEIGVRVRRHRYYDQYGEEITLRADTWGDAESEVEKILNGFGDLLFYGFASPLENGDLRAWRIINLRAFRRALMGCPWREEYETGIKKNGDGTALRYFHLDSLPNGVVFERSD